MKVFKYLLLAVIFVIASCGGKEKKKNEGFSYEKSSSSSQQEVVENVNDVVITGNDAMQFNKKEIKVQSGKKVKITLKHIGKMDKNVMGHNFVLLKQGVDLVAFANKSASARDTDYIPNGGTDVIAHTKLIGGGETAVVEFDAPEKGTYQFLCSFPGHYAMMRGTFIVE